MARQPVRLEIKRSEEVETLQADAPSEPDLLSHTVSVKPRAPAGGVRIAWRRRAARSRLEQLRGDANGGERNGTATDKAAEVELMLLREENARLKAKLHRPSDVGTLVEQLRTLAAQDGPGEALDDVWSLLVECLVIREGLDLACTEINAAIGDVQQRLAKLAIRIEKAEPNTAQSRPR